MNPKNATPASPNTNHNSSPAKPKEADSREQPAKVGQPAQKATDDGKHGASNMPPRGK
jgi:hypothetical protein